MEIHSPISEIPKSALTVLNQLYELEQKLKKHEDPANLSRNIDKMKAVFAEDGWRTWDAGGGQLRIGLVYEDPLGQPFKETRTDLEATISGPDTENLVVVGKPAAEGIYGFEAPIIARGVLSGSRAVGRGSSASRALGSAGALGTSLGVGRGGF